MARLSSPGTFYVQIGPILGEIVSAPETRAAPARRWLCTLLAALLLLGACGSDDAESTPTAPTAVPAGDIPSVPAPYGIVHATWPTARADVEQLMRALPDELNGLARNSVSSGSPRYQVTYGGDDVAGRPRFTIMDLSNSDFFPADWRAEDVISFRRSAVDTETGLDDSLVWQRDRTTENGVPLVSLSWGYVDAIWMYSAAAETEEEVADVVEAVLGAQAEMSD